MEEFLKGVLLGAVVGSCVAAVVVAKNKKLSNKIRQGVGEMQEKLADAKDSLADKLQDCDCFEQDGNCGICDGETKNKYQNKKSKN